MNCDVVKDMEVKSFLQNADLVKPIKFIISEEENTPVNDVNIEIVQL